MVSFERDTSFEQYMPLLRHVTPYTILLRDESVFSMFEVDGLPAQTLDAAVLYRVREHWNHALTGMTAHEGIVLYSWVCRGFADPDIYPAGEFQSDFGRRMDARYREKLFDRFMFLNKTYVGVLIRPPNLAGEWVGEQLSKRTTKRQDVETPLERVRRLFRACDIITGDLAPYKPRRLGFREDSYGRKFSEVCEALAFAMTGVRRAIGVQADYRVGQLLSERIIAPGETVEIRGPGRSEWAACFGAGHMPQTCPPGSLDGFLSAPFRSTIAQSFRPIARDRALALMGNKQFRMVSAGDKAHSQIRQLDLAMDHVQSGRMSMGEHNLVATVFADALPDMRDVANSAWHILQDAGLQVAREDWALPAAFVSMLPGNLRYRPRPGVVTSWNYASMASMHAYPRGDAIGHWGEAQMMVRSTGGTPVYVHIHYNKVGNIFIFGESGSGKTTWLSFLLVQNERGGIQSVVWDKDRGLEIVIRALGGRYLPLDNPTGVAPLKALTNSDEDIHHLAQLIRGLIMIGAAPGFVMTEEEDRRLFVGLRGIMALPPEERWLGDLRAFLGVAPRGAGARLEKWCRAFHGEYAWVLDNPRDMVRLDARVLGFDVTKFLSDPMVCGPIMTHLLYRTGKLADGRRILYIVDESWRVTNIPAFADAAMDGLKTDRKKNAAVVLATQSVVDALDSPIGTTIREQCKTIIGFPIERPDRKDLKRLRYTDRECEIIESLRPGTGQHLIRQGDRSVVAQLPLGGMPEMMAVMSGNEQNIQILDKIRERIGDDNPVALIEEFQKCHV